MHNLTCEITTPSVTPQPFTPDLKRISFINLPFLLWSRKFQNYSTLSFNNVYGPKFTKFPTLVKHLRDSLSWEFAWGYPPFWTGVHKLHNFRLACKI